MRLAVLALVGAAVGVVWAGDPAPDPAALLKQVEGPILGCKTLRTDVAVDFGELGGFKGRLLIAGGNKARLDLDGKLKGQAVTTSLVSDGTRMRSTGLGAPGKDQPTEANLGRTVRAAFARAGVAAPMFLGVEVVPEGEKRQAFDPDRDLVASGVAAAKAEPVGGRDTRALRYSLKMRGVEGPLAVTTWADAKTNLPVKRLVVAKADGETITITETYTNTVLDAKLDDAEFSLPR